ncbi:hypothetical protein GGI07_001223 [Coemansia sp. Benny D115]|nr:hypothetical protein GGI07_001223 [Coemansia sp. Benny D115]
MVGISAHTSTNGSSAAPLSQQQPHGRHRAMFDDRIDAGRQLASNLQEYAGSDSTVVLSVSRGGAVIGTTVAEKLGAHIPHIYYAVRAIPCTRLPRLSLGSVAGDGGVRIDNTMVAGVSEETARLGRVIKRTSRLVVAEQQRFREQVDMARLEGRTVIVVDDGIEAGDVMREAIRHLKHGYRVGRVVVAVPVCLADLKRSLLRYADAVVDVVSSMCVGAVARWYVGGVVASEAEQWVLDRLFVGSSHSGFDCE